MSLFAKEIKDMEELCPICANSFKWFSNGPCDHPICHLCSLRLRALYKNLNCPLCKTECAQIVYSTSKEKPFAAYNLNIMKTDKKLGIYFENGAIYNATLKLLHFNCPQSGCQTVCSGGWQDMKNHVKKSHNLMLCDLCIAHKKCFPHETQTFTTEDLRTHCRTGDKNDSSFKGHPECGFCKVRFYDSDALYDHCREKHEKCFICDRMGMRDQYFANYPALENHFNSEHFPCTEKDCLEKKFVVFGSNVDLQGHILKEHTDGKKKGKGRQIALEFQYANPSSSSHNVRRDRTRTPSSEAPSPQLSTLSLNDTTPAADNRRIRPPSNFGSHLSSSSNVDNFPPPSRARVGATSGPREPQVEAFPLPQAAVSSEEILLTPAQNDILSAAGPDLIVALQKLIGIKTSNMSLLKISIWSFRNGSIFAEVLLNELVGLAEASHPRKTHKQLLPQLSSIWNQIADTLPEEATNSQIQRALEKKSKKKGLTIEEFEALRKGEPKKTAMLRVLNDHKVRILQNDSVVMPRKQSSWAHPEPVLSTVSASSSRAVVGRVSNQPIQNAIKTANSTLSSTSSLNPFPAPPVQQKRPEEPISVPANVSGPSAVRRSMAEFPSLPTAPPKLKPTFSNNRLRQFNGVAPPSQWGSSNEDVNSGEGQSSEQNRSNNRKQKKGKKGTVLMHFG